MRCPMCWWPVESPGLCECCAGTKSEHCWQCGVDIGPDCDNFCSVECKLDYFAQAKRVPVSKLDKELEQTRRTVRRANRRWVERRKEQQNRKVR